jgi:hypothetical protein
MLRLEFKHKISVFERAALDPPATVIGNVRTNQAIISNVIRLIIHFWLNFICYLMWNSSISVHVPPGWFVSREALQRISVKCSNCHFVAPLLHARLRIWSLVLRQLIIGKVITSIIPYEEGSTHKELAVSYTSVSKSEYIRIHTRLLQEQHKVTYHCVLVSDYHVHNSWNGQNEGKMFEANAREQKRIVSPNLYFYFSSV